MNEIVPAILSIEGLSVRLPAGADRTHALSDVSLSVASNEILCVVGESGSGKSMMANAVLRLLPNEVAIDGGRMVFEGRDLAAASEADMRSLRGADIAMIFQEPMTALNPLRTIGDQIAEVFSVHTDLSRAEIASKVLALLADVRIPDPKVAAKAYPHELSGGQRQRAMIAMALALDPKLLIADEPTTALDVTIQAQILALILDLQKELGTGLVLITHDLGVVAQTAQRVIVMYAGKKVEEADVDSLFANPRHPYTRGLMASIPTLPTRGAKASPRLAEIPGTVPSLVRLPPGCAFAPRCPLAVERCRAEYPPLEKFGANHFAACWRAAEMAAAS